MLFLADVMVRNCLLLSGIVYKIYQDIQNYEICSLSISFYKFSIFKNLYIVYNKFLHLKKISEIFNNNKEILVNN